MAAMIRVSTFLVLLSPTRSNSPSCKTRSSLTWSLGEVLLISSRKMLPVWRGLEPAGPIVDRAGERALDVAEELAFEQALGQSTAIDADVRASGARAQVVNGAGDQAPCPVPVSPTIRTQARDGATWWVVRTTSSSPGCSQ